MRNLIGSLKVLNNGLFDVLEGLTWRELHVFSLLTSLEPSVLYAVVLYRRNAYLSIAS